MTKQMNLTTMTAAEKAALLGDLMQGAQEHEAAQKLEAEAKARAAREEAARLEEEARLRKAARTKAIWDMRGMFSQDLRVPRLFDMVQGRIRLTQRIETLCERNEQITDFEGEELAFFVRKTIRSFAAKGYYKSIPMAEFEAAFANLVNLKMENGEPLLKLHSFDLSRIEADFKEFADVND